MRVAANLVERILIAAGEEQRAEERQHGHSSNFNDLVAAFRRAGELRDAKHWVVQMRGRNGGTYTAVVTHEERAVGDTIYRYCLVPAENRRRTLKSVAEVKDETGKVLRSSLIDSGVVPDWEGRWIRSDRLKEAA